MPPERTGRSRSPSLVLAAAALVVALAVGCRAQQAVPAAESFYPLELGRRWLYDTRFYGPNGRGVTTEAAVCRVRDTDEIGRVFLLASCVEDELVEGQFLLADGREIVLPLMVTRTGEPRERQPPEVIARVDMRVGQAWDWEGMIGGEEWHSHYRVANRGRVLTPAGEFEAVRLMVRDESDGPPAVVERWYAPGVGLIKEAGATIFPGPNDEPVQVELVRLLREHGVVPVEQISCCGKVPAED